MTSTLRLAVGRHSMKSISGAECVCSTALYTDATYSSVRVAINAIWGLALYRRQHIVVPFARPVYEAWLEEEIGEGRIAFPGGLK